MVPLGTERVETRGQVKGDDPRSGAWSRAPRRMRLLAGTGVIIIVSCASACGSSPTAQPSTATRSVAASVSPACALITASKASSLLGQAATAVPARSDDNGDSSCLWHPSGSHGGQSSVGVFLYRNTTAVQAFTSSLARPQPPILKISIDGTPALWRPYSGSGAGSAFVSAATSDALLSVEATGGTSGVNGVAKATIETALTSLRSEER